MDEALKDHIVTCVCELLKGSAEPLTTRSLLQEIDAVEDAAVLKGVLNEMMRAGTITRIPPAGPWQLADKAPGVAANPPEVKAACAQAVLAALAMHGGVMKSAELYAACKGHSWANVSYHANALVKRGLVAKPGMGLYRLATTPGAVLKMTTKASRTAPKKKGTPVKQPARAKTKAKAKRPRTALLPGPVSPPTAAKPAPSPDVSLTLRCPAGQLEIRGTPTLVMGFCAQLVTLAEATS